MYFDLHRHDEFSLFDGFGKAEETAKYAKELGYKALGLTNHGNTSGLVRHYLACKDNNIKPILGIEAYFQPKFRKDKKRYHLCMFAKNLKGYENINKIMTFAENNQFYYKPIVTFKDLEKYSEGVIVSSACIAGFLSNLLYEKKYNLAIKAAKKFKSIFNDDFYIEIQPYKISIKNMQEEVNIKLIKLAKKLNIKCIITSDSHYIRQEDLNSYLKMHEISSPEFDANATYGERYMPSEDDIVERMFNMHHSGKYALDYEIDLFTQKCLYNLDELQEKCEDDILSQLELLLPEFIEGKNSFKIIVEDVKKGLRKRKKFNKEYIERCKIELNIIKKHGFSDYFLIVADYVNWAKEQGISVGPGRGSVCNCQVAWALGITDVDSIKFNLDFRRFLRADKKKLPDIDLDFETSRRQEVIDYILEKYKGHTAQIKSYGLYKVDNLINDLVKVCNVEDKNVIVDIKKLIKNYISDQVLNSEKLKKDKRYRIYNNEYDNIIIHFLKMYKKIRFMGTHAAGVAITGGDIEKYTVLKFDKKQNKLFTAYDLADLEKINIIKFDILGLKTVEQIGQLEKLTGDKLKDEWFDNKKIYEYFRQGLTDGIFQFEKAAAKQILRDIHCDCFEDVIAASSMNRPGPLSLGMPSMYAENKFNFAESRKSKYYKYTAETYGTIIYQEQIQNICVNIGNMSWQDADKVMKALKGGNVTDEGRKRIELYEKELTAKFVKGALTNGLTKNEAEDLFGKMLVYSFNKGHGAGYSIISLIEMYYKVYYPTEYWYIKSKFASSDADRARYNSLAAKENVLVFLPHVNYSAYHCLRKIEGQSVIQEGLIAIKNVGEKAAIFIESERRSNGRFKSYDDFVSRCRNRAVTSRVIEMLLEAGALEFDKKKYIKRVTKYNSTLYIKGNM